MISIDAIYESTRKELPDSRWQHTLRVVETALLIGLNYNVSSEDIKVAALLHDYCKYWTLDTNKLWIEKYDLSKDLLDFGTDVSHGPVAAKVAEINFDVTDIDILNAIRYHTTGRPKMGILEKIIFIADCTEPKRQYVGVELVRSFANQDIDKAMSVSFEQIITSLKNRNKRIYPLTSSARNYYHSLIKQEGNN